MHYHLKSKPKNGAHWKTIIAFVLFFVLSILGFVFPNATRSISQTVAKPLWLMKDVVIKPFVGVTNFFVTKNSLINQNLLLQDQVASLKLKEIDYDIVLKENQDLKNDLGQNDNSARVTSRILSKPPQSPYDTLVTDTGSLQGVAVGDKVYLSDNIVVGTVTSVTAKTSLVQLFSSSGQKQETTLSRTGASFEIKGNGGANFVLEVPKDTDIAVGDTFLYPSHLASVVASVYYVDTNSQSSFKTIYLRIPGNIFSSQWVFVEKSQ